MPQMSPMNWIMLMIYFLLLLYMFNMFNFYLALNNPQTSILKFKKIKFNWKW